MDTADDFAALSTKQTVIVGIAVLLSLLGTLVGLAGLLMWGIRAADMVFPGAADAPALVGNLAPYYTIAHFALTVLITVAGILNLMNSTRAHEFLAGGWKRWLLYSSLSVVAGLAFFAIPT